MARFLKHTELGGEILNLFEEAESLITIISPFIKLHPQIKKVLNTKKDDDNFELTLLYGKNEKDLSKSMSKEDLIFFQEFKNIEIFHNPNLHAKYYANETKSIVTSINLHEYSMNHNIEVGILFERTLFGRDNKIDNESVEYFSDILEQSEILFSKRIKQKKYFFGLFKKTTGTEINTDITKSHYQEKKQSIEKPKIGYCIRTKAEIQFNLKKPYCEKAYESWSKWKNKQYAEKFCHYSGEESRGKTSFDEPVLKKYISKI